MNNTSAANSSLKNGSGSSMIVPSKAEGIAWCSAFILTYVFMVVGNTIKHNNVTIKVAFTQIFS